MSHIAATVGWLAFAILVVAGGRLMLTACEVRPWPVFGGFYCPAVQSPSDSLITEQGRQRTLSARVHAAERQLAALPACRPVEPKPDPATEQPPRSDEMKMPTTLAELKGCWVSERGDLPLVSDDDEERPMGRVRECYCFGDTGRGRLVLVYTDGFVCRGRISAKLSDSKLLISQPSMRCGVRSSFQRGRVMSRITCRADASGVALCDTQSLGYRRGLSKDEKFKRAAGVECRQEN